MTANTNPTATERMYNVLTPHYDDVAEYIDGWPRYESTCDVVTVHATSRAEAINKALPELKKQGYYLGDPDDFDSADLIVHEYEIGVSDDHDQ